MRFHKILGFVSSIALVAFVVLILPVEKNKLILPNLSVVEKMQSSSSNHIHEKDLIIVEKKSIQKIKKQMYLTLQMSSTLIELKEKYLSVSGQDKTRIKNTLIKKAKERHTLLNELIKSNPTAVLELALSEKDIIGFPLEAKKYLEKKVKTHGRVEVLCEDDHIFQNIQVNNMKYQLHFSDKIPHLDTDQKVEVEGVLLTNLDNSSSEDGNIAVKKEQVLTLANNGGIDEGSNDGTVQEVPSGLGDHRIAVIMINYQDNPDEKPWTPEQFQDVVFNQVNSFYQEMSYGKTSLSGDVFGWYTIPVDSGNCNRFDDQAKAAVEADGVLLSSYDFIMYVLAPSSGCQLDMASVGGTQPWSRIATGPNFKGIAHEIGHNYGLLHSHDIRCDGGLVYDSSCPSGPYGDIFDVMGAADISGHFNAFQKERLGWLDLNQSQATTEVKTDGIYTISAMSNVDNNIKALKILRSVDVTTGKKTWYYLEYRQPIGFDSPLFDVNDVFDDPENLSNGILIHLGTENDPNSSYLLDMTPDSITFLASLDSRDAALVVGESYSDNGITISPLSNDATSITVSITFDDGGIVTNSIPLANDDNATTTENSTVTINVLANDFDQDGDRLSVTSMSGVDGRAVINSDNTITYTPVSGFIGVETFSYSISDGRGGSASASVSVTVDAIVVSNKAPTADFTFSCSDLSCSFKDSSSDSDGAIVSRSFSFGDGASSTLASPSHTYKLEGSYTVTLTVVDDDGAKSSLSKLVRVSAPSSGGSDSSIQLSTTLRKDRGTKIVTLKWSGASGSSVRIIKDGSYLLSTSNDGNYEDVFKGKATYSYQVCEVGTSTCSSIVINQE